MATQVGPLHDPRQSADPGVLPAPEGWREAERGASEDAALREVREGEAGRTRMPEVALKPCPFCGRPPGRRDRAATSGENGTGHCWFIFCHCGGYSARAHIYGKTEAEAIALWNGRSYDAATQNAFQSIEDIADQYVGLHPAFEQISHVACKARTQNRVSKSDRIERE